jgi:hypothetical protein
MRTSGKTSRALWLSIACGALLLSSGCKIQVDKSKNGQDKNVKIDTPLGGIHVRKDDTAAAEMGVPVYPGAALSADHDGDKSADIHFGFGDWQLRVRVVRYRTSDNPDKVLAFYQKALGRYGDVIHCNGNSAVGSPASTREGLTCDDSEGSKHVHINTQDHEKGLSLKAGSKRHQHIMAIEKTDDAGTEFSLVELQLPKGSDNDKESN